MAARLRSPHPKQSDLTHCWRIQQPDSEISEGSHNYNSDVSPCKLDSKASSPEPTSKLSPQTSAFVLSNWWNGSVGHSLSPTGQHFPQPRLLLTKIQECLTEARKNDFLNMQRPMLSPQHRQQIEKSILGPEPNRLKKKTGRPDENALLLTPPYGKGAKNVRSGGSGRLVRCAVFY